MEENKGFHYCEVPYWSSRFDKRRLWGSAITTCQEHEDGTLWVDNEEYGSQVNFCPVCGYEAKVKIPPDEESE